MFKNIIITILVFTNVYFIYQYNNASYCANNWAGMYWDEEMYNIELQQRIQYLKLVND